MLFSRCQRKGLSPCLSEFSPFLSGSPFSPTSTLRSFVIRIIKLPAVYSWSPIFSKTTLPSLHKISPSQQLAYRHSSLLYYWEYYPEVSKGLISVGGFTKASSRRSVSGPSPIGWVKGLLGKLQFYDCLKPTLIYSCTSSPKNLPLTVRGSSHPGPFWFRTTAPKVLLWNLSERLYPLLWPIFS